MAAFSTRTISVKGLDAFADAHPPVLPVFFAFSVVAIIGYTVFSYRVARGKAGDLKCA